VSCAKTSEPIEIAISVVDSCGPRNHVLDGGPDPRTLRGNFEGEKGLAQYMSGCWHTKSDSEGGRTGTVRALVGVH